MRRPSLSWGRPFSGGSHGSFLKGSVTGSGVGSSEQRVRLSHAYVALARCLGAVWLERQLPALLNHVLQLLARGQAANAKATHTEMVQVVRTSTK